MCPNEESTKFGAWKKKNKVFPKPQRFCDVFSVICLYFFDKPVALSHSYTQSNYPYSLASSLLLWIFSLSHDSCASSVFQLKAYDSGHLHRTRDYFVSQFGFSFPISLFLAKIHLLPSCWESQLGWPSFWLSLPPVLLRLLQLGCCSQPVTEQASLHQFITRREEINWLRALSKV